MCRAEDTVVELARPSFHLHVGSSCRAIPLGSKPFVKLPLPEMCPSHEKGNTPEHCQSSTKEQEGGELCLYARLKVSCGLF